MYKTALGVADLQVFMMMMMMMSSFFPPHHLLLVVLLVFAWIQAAESQFLTEGKKYILDRHNELRSKIALGKYVAKGVTKPAATNMAMLRWDAGLAKAAQTFAATCPTGHSKNRNNTGENLYWWSSSASTTTNLQVLGNSSSVLWADEFQKFGWPSNKLTMELFNTGIGHATQMAWAKTSKVGCGVAKCAAAAAAASSGTKYTVACQYQSAGNYLNSDIYESGTTCSKCPTGTKCQPKTGLCV